MAYVQSGGQMVVQYNTNNRLLHCPRPFGSVSSEIAASAYDETATVLLTTPDHAR